jgi:hypothetical protein
MKKLALTVRTLAPPYSKVITETVNRDFGFAAQATRQVNGESAMVVAKKQDTMHAYLADAEKRCQESNLQVSKPDEKNFPGQKKELLTISLLMQANRMLRARMEEVDRAKPSMRQKQFVKKHKP